MNNALTVNAKSMNGGNGCQELGSLNMVAILNEFYCRITMILAHTSFY